MASQQSWLTVGGLYETLKHRWHIDSISLLRFRAQGLQQQILQAPLCIFHQDHQRSNQDVSFGSLDVVALSQAPASTDWGFRDEILPEISLRLK